MAGRWVMASIQTSFAVMPAAVYWFGGYLLAHGSHALSVPLLVSFTTLQTRLFFPVGSLLGVGLDVQTSLALFDRIFEYLDEPIDIEEKPDAIAVGRAGDVVFDHVWFGYGDEWTVKDVSFTVPAGTTTALVGETGSGKTTLAYLAARLYDVGQRPHHDRRYRRARPDVRGALEPRRRRLPGDVPLPRDRARKSPLREARRDRRRDRGGRAKRLASTR